MILVEATCFCFYPMTKYPTILKPRCRIKSPRSGWCNITQPSTSPDVKVTCSCGDFKKKHTLLKAFLGIKNTRIPLEISSYTSIKYKNSVCFGWILRLMWGTRVLHEYKSGPKITCWWALGSFFVLVDFWINMLCCSIDAKRLAHFFPTSLPNKKKRQNIGHVHPSSILGKLISHHSKWSGHVWTVGFQTYHFSRWP